MSMSDCLLWACFTGFLIRFAFINWGSRLIFDLRNSSSLRKQSQLMVHLAPCPGAFSHMVCKSIKWSEKLSHSPQEPVWVHSWDRWLTLPCSRCLEEYSQSEATGVGGRSARMAYRVDLRYVCALLDTKISWLTIILSTIKDNIESTSYPEISLGPRNFNHAENIRIFIQYLILIALNSVNLK